MSDSEIAIAIKKKFSEISNLPAWMQTILLRDIEDAIGNRVHTMETILQNTVHN